MYTAYIYKLKQTDLKPHPKAQDLKLANIYGKQIVIQSVAHGWGIYFPTGGQLSNELCHFNDLYKDSNLNSDKKSTDGYVDKNRRVKAQSFKGKRSEGLWLPIKCLSFIGSVNSTFWTATIAGETYNNEDPISAVGDYKICQGYVNPQKIKTKKESINKKQDKLVPSFVSNFNVLNYFRPQTNIPYGSTVIITEQLNGISGRCGYLPVNLRYNDWLSKASFGLVNRNPKWKCKFVIGSSKAIIAIQDEDNSVNYYDEDDIYIRAANRYFKNRLNRGETVYYEIVGFDNGKSLAPIYNNLKLEPHLGAIDYNKFLKHYGQETTFSYNLKKDFRVYVYRITQQTPQGPIDLSWQQLRNRCRKIGCKFVPELYRDIVLSTAKETIGISGGTLDDLIKKLTSGTSGVFPNHIRKGVCIRIEHGALQPTILKNNSYHYKVLSGKNIKK